MPHAPYIQIEDAEFAELASKVNFFQRLLYIPYSVFTSAAIGILYGLLLTLPIIWMPFVQVQGFVLVMIMICIVFCSSVISTVFVFTGDGIGINLLVLLSIWVASIMLGTCLAVYSPIVNVDRTLLTELATIGSWSIWIAGSIVISAISGILQIIHKGINKVISNVAGLSQMELRHPFGEDFNEFKDLGTRLPDYFNDLRKVVKKRSSQNVFKQWFIKWNAFLAGCGVILYLPIIAFIESFYLIWRVNLIIQRWGVYQILRITTPDKIKKGISSDTPSLTG